MDSKIVLDLFKDITRIPRESGHEEQIISFLQQFAQDHALECHTDEAGNVVIIQTKQGMSSSSGKLPQDVKICLQ